MKEHDEETRLFLDLQEIAAKSIANCAVTYVLEWRDAVYSKQKKKKTGSPSLELIFLRFVLLQYWSQWETFYAVAELLI